MAPEDSDFPISDLFGENLLLQALNASNSGIIITDNMQPDNPIIYCNRRFEDMTGYGRDEIIGHNCRFLQMDDRKQEARKLLKDAIAKGKNCVVEIRNYKKDGTLFWNELYMAPVTNERQEVTHFIGVQNDVSQRKRIQQELQRQKDQMEQKILERTRYLEESKEYLTSIFETVRESLIVLDRTLRVLTVNEYFLNTFKVTLEETEGKQFYELGNGQWNIASLRKVLEEVLPTNNPVLDYEVELEFPHIGKKIMQLNAYRVELEGEYKDRILMAIEDITERRELENRKDDFLSIASHELRTPLTSISGFVQMLDRLKPDNVSDKFKEVLGKTVQHVSRLNNLIEELLDVSRIRSGNIKLYRQAFNFDKIVYETVETMKQFTKTHRISIEGKAAAKLIGDESHIVQVVNNLLSNAIKYSPEGTEIYVYLSQVSNYVKVSIKDSGIGISNEDRKKIFERFFRVTSSQEKYPGMGIGLYVCQQIIENHKGTIWVESEPNRGATFSFTLPIK